LCGAGGKWLLAVTYTFVHYTEIRFGFKRKNGHPTGLGGRVGDKAGGKERRIENRKWGKEDKGKEDRGSEE
jgi:hypothetical protein